MTFTSEMARAEKIIIDACEKTVRGTALRLFGEIIRVTPVGNRKLWKINEKNTGQLQPKGYIGGRLRNNWQATLKRPATGEVSKADKGGSDANASVQRVTKAYSIDDLMFLTNNLPYADRVENGGWSRKQRPQGMMRSTVLKFLPYINQEARGNKV
jgi:hypothetical protein